jgi:LacI family gluconate utilization system Gnt-I transcriptional repressor
MLGLPEIPEIPVGVSSMTRVDQGAYCMKWLLSNCPGVDAVFCMNDWMALGAINEIQRQGKAVPADIAVAGVGDTDFSRERGLGITSVRVPGGEIGRMAARLILERGDSDSDDHTVIDLGFDIVRRSTA